MGSIGVQIDSQPDLWASASRRETEYTTNGSYGLSASPFATASFEYPGNNAPLPRSATAYQDGHYPRDSWGVELAELYSENIVAKIFRTATQSIDFSPESRKRALQGLPLLPASTPGGFPEYVPQDGSDAGQYHLREPEFWTCGFFPGSLHGIFERLVRFPQSLRFLDPSTTGTTLKGVANGDPASLRSEFRALCELWAEPLHAMAHRTDTHDVGFIIMPALRLNWELTGSERSLESILRAARSLASRYVPAAKAIRSWDERIQKNIQITCKEENLILIVDSLCNLDLLYYAANHCSDDDGAFLYQAATDHAATLLRTHLRPEVSTPTSSDAYNGQWYSTFHVANLNPRNGDIKKQFTAQGYVDSSTWARGQSWGILGYAQTYMWTKDKKFLHASCGLAEYFIYRLEKTVPPFPHANGGASNPHRGGRFVPLWDFDEPVDDQKGPIRDSSAAAIAANGLLVLSQGLAALGDDKLAARFRNAALDMTRDLLTFALAPEKARFTTRSEGGGGGGGLQVEDVVPEQSFEALLQFGTANNNQHARKRYANHGLVYGDYYLIELGNRILRMGLN